MQAKLILSTFILAIFILGSFAGFFTGTIASAGSNVVNYMQERKK